MNPIHLVSIFAATLVSSSLAMQTGVPRGHLPKCEYDTETQFYNVDIDVLELPESCGDHNLIDIGLLIQTVVDEVEARMPDYREEYMTTQVCPFPDEVDEERRRQRKLSSIAKASLSGKHEGNTRRRTIVGGWRKLASRKKRYKFKGSGRCRRCKNKTTARFLLYNTEGTCVLAEQTKILQEQVGYSVETSMAILRRMQQKARDTVFQNADLGDILWQAKEYVSDCLNEAEDATKAAESITELCHVSSRLRTQASLISDNVRQELTKAKAAALRAKDTLTQMRALEFRMNTLYHQLDSGQHRELRRRRRRSPRPAPRPAPGPFGIEDFILVDASSDRDIVAIGAPGCEPLNKCFGSATSFNIRAKTFGDVGVVRVASDGPIKEWGRDEGIAPYSVWGDDGYGHYFKNDLVAGTYTVAARATDRWGNMGTTFTKTFTVLSPSAMAAQATPAPTPAPTKSPTSSPTARPTVEPTISPTRAPTVSPTTSPTVAPTAKPTASPTGMPTESPTFLPTTSPTMSPTASPTTIPTALPTQQPTGTPTSTPTVLATALPTRQPTGSPTVIPTDAPTELPTLSPTAIPTASPTTMPTGGPTKGPTSSPTELPTASPTGSPTERPTNSPSVSPLFTPQGDNTEMPSSAPSSSLVKLLARSEEDFVVRFSTNLATSNTNCEEVKPAMIQKTLAEETGAAGDQIYDEINSLARGYEGNANVDRIKTAAEAAHLKVKDEAAKACAAANLASDLCRDSRVRRLENAELIQEEVDVAAAAVLESRLALSETKTARDEMEEAVALIEFDPEMSELEAKKRRDEKKLEEHLDTVGAAISEVDSKIETLPEDSPELPALEKKRDSLVEEEMQIEEVLINEEQFVISQSALKKEEFYDSVAPDFEESPPLQYIQTSPTPEIELASNSSLLQYILRTRTDQANTTTEANWEIEDETAGSKAEWFRRFGDWLVEDVQTRLFLVYNTDVGGCIPEDSALSIVVVVTELGTIWEQFGVPMCSTEFLARGFGRPEEQLDETSVPSSQPLRPSDSPSMVPSTDPSQIPSKEPSASPSGMPSSPPSRAPSGTPSNEETMSPSLSPSLSPSDTKSNAPTDTPSSAPSRSPTDVPSFSPSTHPTDEESESPSSLPSASPSTTGSSSPTSTPSNTPSLVPTDIPSNLPSFVPTEKESEPPSTSPSGSPSIQGSSSPTAMPSDHPSLQPSSSPSGTPSISSSESPTETPSKLEVPVSLDGVVLYNEGLSGSIRRNIFSEDTVLFDDSHEIANKGSTKWRYMRGASSPSRDEKILVAINSDADLYAWMCRDAQCHGTGEWDEIPLSPLGTNLVDYFFPHANVAYESQSGDALLVFGNAGDGLRYSKWNGNVWSDVDEVTAYSGRKAHWIEAASNPQSNEITVIVTDSRSDDYVLVWSGTGWSDPIGGSIDTSGDSFEEGSSTTVAYETSSGVAMVVYEEIGSGDTAKLYYRLSSSWSTRRVLEPPSGVTGHVYWTSLDSNRHPDSNQIVLGVQTYHQEFWISVWNDGFWDTPIKTSAGTWAYYVPNVAVAFESGSGSNGRAVAAFGSPPYSRTWSNGQWSAEMQIASYNANTLTLDPHPVTNEIMMTVLDQSAPYGSHCVLWDGSEWTLDVKVTSDTNDFKNQPFLFMWDQPLATVASPSPTEPIDSGVLQSSETTIQNAFIRGGAPYSSINNGGSTRLTVKSDNALYYTRRAFLQFDLRGINGFVSEATVLLKVGFVDKEEPVVHDIYSVPNNNWKENEITWDNMPDLGPVVASQTISITNAASRDFIEFDVTPHINTLVASNTPLASFAVAAETKGVVIEYFSNHAASSDAPKLEVSSSSFEKIEPSPVVPRLVLPGGVAVFNHGSNGVMKSNAFDGTSFLDGKNPPEVAKIGSSKFRWLRGADSPTRDEKVVVATNKDNTISAAMCSGIQCRDSSSWTEISISPLATDISSSDSWPHANIAYESKTGRAMLVWDGGRPRFSIFDGEEWTMPAYVDSSFPNEPEWIELASNPQNNEIVLAFGTYDDELFTSFWDGSQWSPIGQAVSSISQCSGFAVAYEAQAPNRAILVHGRVYGDNADNALYRVQSGSSWSDVQYLIPSLGGRVQWASLRSDPDSNRLVLGIHDTSNDAHLAIWDGDNNEWIAIDKDLSTSVSDSNNRARVSVAFETESGRALAVVGRSNKNNLDSYTWTPGEEEWNKEERVDVGGKSFTFTLDANPDPSSNDVMLSVNVGEEEFQAQLWDGSSSTWRKMNPDPIGSKTEGGTRTQPFVFIWNR